VPFLSSSSTLIKMSTIKHFAGWSDCGISKSDIYLAPWPVNTRVSPFCKTRAMLLEALSSGGRYGWDEPYVGKGRRELMDTELLLTPIGCTYRWFSTAEICMILERFNSIVFVGDEIAQSIYAAFNILLREDLAFGGLQQWVMPDQDRLHCKCNHQFLNQDCLGYRIKNRDEVKKKAAGGERKGSEYLCESRCLFFNHPDARSRLWLKEFPTLM
jgi:hypothetical protein